MNRTELQQLAELRISEAGILLANRAWDGAYYLAGYAVECALKACIAKQTQAEEFPDKKRAERAWKHDVKELLAAAGLADVLHGVVVPKSRQGKFWDSVYDWSEQSRYTRNSRQLAEELFEAITDNQLGVLPWLRQHW